MMARDHPRECPSPGGSAAAVTDGSTLSLRLRLRQPSGPWGRLVCRPEARRDAAHNAGTPRFPAGGGADACRRTVTSPLGSRRVRALAGDFAGTPGRHDPRPGASASGRSARPWPSGNQVGVGLRVRRRGCGSRQNPKDFDPAVVPVFNSSEPASGYAWEPRTDWSVHRSVKVLPRLSCQEGPAIGGAVRLERGARRRGRRTA
jgi:hypothetical protein